MREEADFSVLYKKLIDGHFAPERQRAEAALFAVMSRLSEPEPVEEPDFLKRDGQPADLRAKAQTITQEQRGG